VADMCGLSTINMIAHYTSVSGLQRIITHQSIRV